VEILSILFLWDQRQKTSNQAMELEQVFQQNVCAMAQEVNNGVAKIRRKFYLLKCHVHHYTILPKTSFNSTNVHILANTFVIERKKKIKIYFVK